MATPEWTPAPLKTIVRLSPEIKSWLNLLQQQEQKKVGETRSVTMDEIATRVIADGMRVMSDWPAQIVTGAALRTGPKRGDRYGTFKIPDVRSDLLGIKGESHSPITLDQLASFFIRIAYQIDHPEEQLSLPPPPPPSEAPTTIIAVNELPLLTTPRDTTDRRAQIPVPLSTPTIKVSFDATRETFPLSASTSPVIPKTSTVTTTHRRNPALEELREDPLTEPVMGKEEIRRTRESFRLSQARLATAIGVSRGLIAEAESGRRSGEITMRRITTGLRRLLASPEQGNPEAVKNEPGEGAQSQGNRT